MATKIRLQRFGKKGRPFYHVVVADSRAPRDGKFIERLGSYNPNTNPATVELHFDKALNWLNNGAQPTDTCRSILSHQGVLYKKHLEGGIKKGALTTEQAEAKFATWQKEKDSQIESKEQVETIQIGTGKFIIMQHPLMNAASGYEKHGLVVDPGYLKICYPSGVDLNGSTFDGKSRFEMDPTSTYANMTGSFVAYMGLKNISANSAGIFKISA